MLTILKRQTPVLPGEQTPPRRPNWGSHKPVTLPKF